MRQPPFHKYFREKPWSIWWIVLMVAVLALLVCLPEGFARRTLPNPPSVPLAVAEAATTDSSTLLYGMLHLQQRHLSTEAFTQAWQGYRKLQHKGLLRKPILAIADFSQASAQKRLYIIDLKQMRLLAHTLVAHGRNSGDAMATRFSNQPSSWQSSLGFFVTGNTYQGNNGYSLRLHGQEPGINDAAYSRAVVMHGANYVSEAMAKAAGRIGRSWGCPAISQAEHKQIIDLLKDGTCLFIYAPQQHYVAHSSLLKTE